MSEEFFIRKTPSDMARAKLWSRRDQVRLSTPNLTGGAPAGMAN